MRSVLSLLVGAAFVTATSVAGAQDISGAVPGTGPTQTVSGGSITDTSGPTDHSIVVSRLSLRYFGTSRMSVLSGVQSSLLGYGSVNSMTNSSITTETRNAAAAAMATAGRGTLHTVGVRYWINGVVGIEGGLAIGFSSGSTQTTPASPADDPNFFGIGLQAGVPIMLAESKHLSINLTPLIAFHYATSAITAANNTADLSGRSFALTIGANAGAELQFGFIGIPQLALQAQLGLQLRYTQSTLENVPRNGGMTTQSTASEFALGTTVGPNYGLGDILGGSLSVIYYFGNAPTR